MKRQLRFIGLLIRLKLSRMMMFRLSFFGATFVDGTLFVVQLAMFSAIYSHVDSIGGWARAEMIVFVGTFSMLNALNMVVYFFGVIEIPRKIITGDLDHYLTKPVNPLLRLTFENVNPGSVPLVLMSALIIGYGASMLPVRVTPVAALVYAALVLLMALLYYDVELMLRTVPLFFPSANRMDRLEELLELCFKIPGTLFTGAYKVLFYCLLPYGVMATVPAQWLAGTLTPLGLLYGVGIVAVFTVLALWLWKAGLRRYRSASS